MAPQSDTHPMDDVTRLRGRALRRTTVAVAWALVLLLAGGRLVLGLSMTSVLSESMAPEFRRGDLVITRLVSAQALRVGDVPVVVPPGGTVPYMHRVVSLDAPAGSPVVLRTKGDANEAPDAWTAELTTGEVPVVVGAVPGLGRLTLSGQPPALHAGLVALLGVLVTALAVREVLHHPEAAPPEQPRPEEDQP